MIFIIFDVTNRTGIDMRRSLWVYVFIFFVAGCANSRWRGTYFREFQEDTYLINSKTNIKVKYYGDYLFKKLRKRTTPDFGNAYHKELKKEGKLLYDSYTFLEPYASSRLYYYRNETLESIKISKMASLENLKIEEVKDDQLNKTLLIYSMEETKKDTTLSISYCEYLFPCKEGVASVIFWTDGRPNWLRNESMGVIQTLSVEEVD